MNREEAILYAGIIEKAAAVGTEKGDRVCLSSLAALCQALGMKQAADIICHDANVSGHPLETTGTKPAAVKTPATASTVKEKRPETRPQEQGTEMMKKPRPSATATPAKDTEQGQKADEVIPEKSTEPVAVEKPASPAQAAPSKTEKAEQPAKTDPLSASVAASLFDDDDWSLDDDEPEETPQEENNAEEEPAEEVQAKHMPVHRHTIKLCDKEDKSMVKEYTCFIAPLEIPDTSTKPGIKIATMLVHGDKKTFASSEIDGRTSVDLSIPGDNAEFMCLSKWKNGRMFSSVYTKGETKVKYDQKDVVDAPVCDLAPEGFMKEFLCDVPDTDEKVFVFPCRQVNETDGLAEIMVAAKNENFYNIFASNEKHVVLIQDDSGKDLRIFGKWIGDEFKSTIEWV